MGNCHNLEMGNAYSLKGQLDKPSRPYGVLDPRSEVEGFGQALYSWQTARELNFQLPTLPPGGETNLVQICLSSV